MSEPRYKLIQVASGDPECKSHKKESIKDLFNNPLWIMGAIDIDKIKFTCAICGSERTYQLLPEKTLL